MDSKIRFLRKCTVFLSLGLFLSGFALTAFAQETQEKGTTTESTQWRRKPAFAFKLGAFFPSTAATLRVDRTVPGGGTVEGTEVSLENDLGLAKNATTLRLDGDIRIASWFSLDLGYYGLNRSKSSVIDKDIQIGDTVFSLNQTIDTSLNLSTYRADFKFYLVHNSRLDFGVYAGVYLTHFKLTFKAMEIDRELLEIRRLWAPIPSLGLHFSYALIPNLYLYGKAGYFYLKPSKRTTFNSFTLNVNLDYYFYKFLGIGARYEYGGFKYDLDVASYHGMIKYNVGGFNTYLTIGF